MPRRRRSSEPEPLENGQVRVAVRTGPRHRHSTLEVLGEALDVPPDAIALERTVHGKPFIREPGSNLRFSVAHTVDLTLYALALGTDVGIDVEPLHRDVVDWTLWRHALTGAESARLPVRRTERHVALLLYWVRKEAVLKAAGFGLAVEPRAIEIGDDGTLVSLPARLGAAAEWAIHDLCVPGHAAAVACRSQVEIVGLDDLGAKFPVFGDGSR